MKKIIYKSEVIDNEDTHLLGRIRCKPSDWKIQSILDELKGKGILNTEGNDVDEKYKYTKDDPFVFMPLLPMFLSLIPKKKELVWLTYSDPKNNWGKKEQFYISVVKSDPFNLKNENFQQAQVMTNEGVNFALGTGYKSPEITGNTENTKYPQRQYRDQIVKGLFAEPGDNAIYGQGSTDIILKEDEIIMRAGKTDIMPNQMTVPNEQRAFFQMSYFKTEGKIKDPVINEITRIDESPLRYLIEYQIDNLENSFDLFNGFVRIYDLGPKFAIKNNEFTVDTQVDLAGKTPVYSAPFSSQSMSAITDTINYVINSLNKGRIEQRETPIFTPARTFENPFPFFYRPSNELKKYVGMQQNSNGTFDFIKNLNANLIVTKVKFIKAILNSDGNGLVSKKNTFGVSNFTEKVYTQETEWMATRNSVNLMGSNKIVLLSHESIVPGKESVNLKVNGDNSTIYGLNSDDIFGNIFSNTEPMVRGEKLKEFLTLIVSFLTTHTHDYPGLPPNSTSFSGVEIDDIEQSFQNYDQNVINQNIRIN